MHITFFTDWVNSSPTDQICYAGITCFIQWSKFLTSFDLIIIFSLCEQMLHLTIKVLPDDQVPFLMITFLRQCSNSILNGNHSPKSWPNVKLLPEGFIFLVGDHLPYYMIKLYTGWFNSLVNDQSIYYMIKPLTRL